MMALLNESIAVSGRFARSANLERDETRTEPFDGYVVTARALDVVERIARAAAFGPSGGAWSLTGPYGSGKSSLALLIDAVFGNVPQTRHMAMELINEASSDVVNLVREAHQRYQTSASGFSSGLVTAEREPLTHTILRALHKAVIRRYGKIPSDDIFPAASLVHRAQEDIANQDPRRIGPSPATLIDIAKSLVERAPLLLIIDEFGKNLEAFRDGADSDPYLLQQLAEVGQSSSGLPLFVLTLQHLSFEDYLGRVDDAQRREWAKVQGRFEDVAFLESPAQARALIQTVFKTQSRKLDERIKRWAEQYAPAMRSLGIRDLATPQGIASCYPLHPLSAVVLPELCSRYGQHERTLFSFLAGPDPNSVSSFLATQTLEADGPLPSVELAKMYDFFVTNGMGSQQSSRWTEMAVRIRDAYGLTPAQEKLVKAIAVLNLVSTGGSLRASRQVLALIDGQIEETLAGLEATGLVTYRDFADEYRLWQGTDADIPRILEAARRLVEKRPLVETMSDIDEPSPVVAARHNAENQVLRVFKRRYVASSQVVEPLHATNDFDGEVLLVVDEPACVPTVSYSKAHLAKPVVAAIPTDLTDLNTAAKELAAIQIALEDPVITNDWVARRELGERLAQVRSIFDSALSDTFDAGRCRWVLLSGDKGNIELSVGRGSAPISQAADLAYQSTPVIPNEMVNRASLTSQGAQARRLLLEAMINSGDHPDLGLSGYGPEVAVYQALLKHSGIHTLDNRNQAMSFGTPSDESLQPAWKMVMHEFKRATTGRVNLHEIYTILQSPPIGMKNSVVPIFLTACLLAQNDEIAIYEHGTFKPILTSEISQRMVRNPAHFDIKHFDNITGARKQVIDALSTRLGIKPKFQKHRVPNVLAVVGDLVKRMGRIDNYTRRTQDLTPATVQARDALLEAVEPDRLLFHNLPMALGFKPVLVDSPAYHYSDEYAKALGEAVEELESAYPNLLDNLLEMLLATSVEKSRLAIAGQAEALSEEVLDPRVRPFVLALANTHFESDTDWIKTIATVVMQKAPAEWRDADLKQFQHELPQQVAAFRRLVALHTQHRADGGGPFVPFRVTFTRPDGREDFRLVSVDQDQRDRIAPAFQAFIDRITEDVGSSMRAKHALLALLGEQLLPSSSATAEPPEEIPNLRVQDG